MFEIGTTVTVSFGDGYAVGVIVDGGDGETTQRVQFGDWGTLDIRVTEIMECKPVDLFDILRAQAEDEEIDRTVFGLLEDDEQDGSDNTLLGSLNDAGFGSAGPM